MNKLLALIVAALITSAATAQNLRPWTEYRVILWMGESGQKALANPVMPERLRELGITSGMIGPGGDPTFFAKNGFGHYVENIVNEGLCLKFRSNVTNWEKFVTEWAKTRDKASLVRDYPLEDSTWLQRMSEHMKRTARDAMLHSPLLYDLRDELSTTISANPFDYDYSPTSLAAFRAWLKTRYASLDFVFRLGGRHTLHHRRNQAADGFGKTWPRGEDRLGRSSRGEARAIDRQTRTHAMELRPMG
jgi:hypothetical protein